MKTFSSVLFLAIASVIVSLSASTAQAAYDPANHNCSAMQAVLAKQGYIDIQRLFGSVTYTHLAHCYGGDEARAHFEWAKDTSACHIGWDCIEKHR